MADPRQVVVTRTRGDAEITPVSPATEVHIPWMNYLKFGQVLMHLALIPWVVGCLLFARYWAGRIGYWRWLVDKWWPWIALNWTWIAVTLVLCWVGPSVAYAIYLLIETLAKRTPAYTPWPSEWGIWRPQIFKRFSVDEDDTDEMETETMDINLWDLFKGRKSRKRCKTLPDFLTSAQARQFYRGVTADPPTVTFSERGAKRFHIKPGKFRRHIRDALFTRGLAEWEDEENHSQGVKLSVDALRTMELLGRQR